MNKKSIVDILSESLIGKSIKLHCYRYVKRDKEVFHFFLYDSQGPVIDKRYT